MQVSRWSKFVQNAEKFYFGDPATSVLDRHGCPSLWQRSDWAVVSSTWNSWSSLKCLSYIRLHSLDWALWPMHNSQLRTCTPELRGPTVSPTLAARCSRPARQPVYVRSTVYVQSMCGPHALSRACLYPLKFVHTVTRPLPHTRLVLR